MSELDTPGLSPEEFAQALKRRLDDIGRQEWQDRQRVLDNGDPFLRSAPMGMAPNIGDGALTPTKQPAEPAAPFAPIDEQAQMVAKRIRREEAPLPYFDATGPAFSAVPVAGPLRDAGVAAWKGDYPTAGYEAGMAGLQTAMPLVGRGANAVVNVAGQYVPKLAEKFPRIAGAAREGVSRLAQSGAYAGGAAGLDAALSPNQAQAGEPLPHERWFTPQGALKIGPNSNPAEIRSMQEFLKGLNLYTGPLDGKWQTGTAKAAGSYAGQLGDQYRLDQEGKKADAAKSALETAAQATAKRQQDAEKFAGFADQWRQAHPVKAWIAEHPWLSAAVPGLASLALGAVSQPWAAKKFYKADQRALEAATRDVRSAGRTDIETGAGRGERATTLNALWRRGGANDVPFERGGRGWRHEPGAPGADTLYPEPNLATRARREGAALAMTGVPEAGAEFWFGNPGKIQEQLGQARVDLERGYTEERAQKVLELEHQLNEANAYQRGAGGFLVGSGLAAGKRTFLPQNSPYFRQYGAAERYRQELADRLARRRRP